MRAWLTKRKRTKMMNRVLRTTIGMSTADATFDVLRFSYVDEENVEVTWKIHDFYEDHTFDAHVRFIASLDEAVALIEFEHVGVPRVNGYYTVLGRAHVPFNIMWLETHDLTNRPAELIVSARGMSVSEMTMIPKTSEADAMIRLRLRAQDIYARMADTNLGLYV